MSDETSKLETVEDYDDAIQRARKLGQDDEQLRQERNNLVRRQIACREAIANGEPMYTKGDATADTKALLLSLPPAINEIEMETETSPLPNRTLGRRDLVTLAGGGLLGLTGSKAVDFIFNDEKLTPAMVYERAGITANMAADILD